MSQTVDRLLLLIEAKMKGVEEAQKSVRNLQRGLKAFQGMVMGVALSMMFTGMAMKRFFEGILQNIITTFMTVSGEQSYVSDKIHQLQAAWIFLLSSLMMSAEATGVFDKWIEELEGIADWFDKLSEKTQGNLIDFIVWGAVIGTIMSVAGQALLGVLAPIAIVAWAIEMGILPLMLKIGAILLILGILVVVLFAIWNSDMSTTEKIFWTVVAVIIAAIILMGLFGIVASLPFILIVLGVLIVIGLFMKLVKETGGVGNAFKMMGYSILRIFAIIGDGILNVLRKPINWVIDSINEIIRLYNTVAALTGRETVAEIERMGESDMTNDVEDRMRAILDSVEKTPKDEEGGFLKNLIPDNVTSGALMGFQNPNLGFMNQPPQNTNNYNVNIEGDVISEGELQSKIVSWIEDYTNNNTGSPFN